MQHTHLVCPVPARMFLLLLTRGFVFCELGLGHSELSSCEEEGVLRQRRGSCETQVLQSIHTTIVTCPPPHQESKQRHPTPCVLLPHLAPRCGIKRVVILSVRKFRRGLRRNVKRPPTTGMPLNRGGESGTQCPVQAGTCLPSVVRSSMTQTRSTLRCRTNHARPKNTRSSAQLFVVVVVGTHPDPCQRSRDINPTACAADDHTMSVRWTMDRGHRTACWVLSRGCAKHEATGYSARMRTRMYDQEYINAWQRNNKAAPCMQ